MCITMYVFIYYGEMRSTLDLDGFRQAWKDKDMDIVRQTSYWQDIGRVSEK